ncbi:MAG: extracellular solute-binding protein [Lachnospiraceae bacterium]|nr:extracellular solute-binding protein [Candidatus Colinaster scatohippi]
MKENKRIIAALLCMAMVVAVVFAGRENTIEEVDTVEVFDNDSLVVWYTDDSLTDYLNSMAVEFHEKNGVRVLPKLQTGDDYIESIYKASMEEKGAPDLYILADDALEKAYMSGCASVIDDEEIVSDVNYPAPAIKAVSYHHKPVAYPYYFETTALIYNESYLYEMATNLVQAHNAKNPDDNSDEEETSEEPSLSEKEQIEARVKQTIPSTFDDLLTFANEFDAPPDVETIYKWDVRDIFYNYFFVGNYINIGGENGDDASVIDIYNTDAIKAFSFFQDMNQFFAFESAEVTYKQVVDEFIQGKLVYATVTSDALASLREAKADGSFKYDYGITMIPDLTEEMDTRSLSVTNTLVVNGYSNKRKEANDFARYLCIDNADSLYEKTDKLPSKIGVFDKDSEEFAFVQEYSYSVPMPKMMATSNCWLLMEGTFADIWSGKDVSMSLKELSEQIKHQVTGEDVSEEYIEYEEETESIEYLDEEALKEAAQNETEED